MKRILGEIFSGTSLTAAALAILLIANLVGLVRARGEMAQARDRQEAMLTQGGKIETQLESLARDTRALADSGNANARKVVEVLGQNGININAPGATR